MATYSEDVIPLCFADPQGNATMPLWECVGDGSKTTIVGANVTVMTTLAASSANYHSVQLLKCDATGTVNGTISSIVGGTAASGTAPGWTAGTVVDIPITNGALDSGEFVAVKHAETGTVAPLNVAVQLKVVRGPKTI